MNAVPWFALALAVPSPSQEDLTVLDAPLVITSSSRRIDHMLDWNGDGSMDLASITRSSSQLDFLVHLNDGRGAFPSASGSGVRTDRLWESHLDTCDGDMDGVDDLLFVAHSPTGGSGIVNGYALVFARRPDGSAQFIDHLEYEGSSLLLAAVLDADLDGDADRVRVSRSGLFELDRFEQDAGGQWQVTTQSVQLPFVPQAILRLDFDGDAHPDLYLPASGRGAFVPLAGGAPGAPVVLVHGIATDMPMAIPGDVDGDGDEDLALFDATGYALYRRLGPASWTLEPRRSGGPAARFADVDRDGDLDGVCCGGGGNSSEEFDQPATFRIALNDGDGGFAPAFTIPGLGAREIAGAADLDGDGDVDLAGGQCVYFARGPLKGPPQRALGAAQCARSLFDFDFDGDADFTPGAGTFPRHLGDGRSSPFTLLSPPAPAGTSDEGPGLPGDWDGDGDRDLIVRRWQGTAFLEMRLLLNEGGGTYADGGTASAVDLLPGVVGVRPESSFALDLDLDGDVDLVTTHRGPNRASHWTRTWLNDGGGQLTLSWLRTGDWALAFAPLTGSPAPDAVLVHPPFAGYDILEDIYLYPGLGTGAFESTSVLSARLGTGVSAAGIAIADFDLDGDVDLAGAFEFGGYDSRYGMGWFLPSNAGTFSLDERVLLDRLEPADSSTPPAPLARVAHAVDANGDGLQDVVLSSPLSRRAAVSIVLRASDNSGWLPPRYQVVYPVDPDDPDNVVAEVGAWLDLDGDGDPEYVTDVVWDGTPHGEREWGARRQDTAGSPDAAGRVPTLGASGSLRPGGTLQVRLTNVPAGAVGILEVAGAQVRDRIRALPERFFPVLTLLTTGPETPGAGLWTRTLVIPPSFAAAEHRLRVELLDPDDPGRSLRSNQLALSFGR
jgi:hypothetical protein